MALPLPENPLLSLTTTASSVGRRLPEAATASASSSSEKTSSAPGRTATPASHRHLAGSRLRPQPHQVGTGPEERQAQGVGQVLLGRGDVERHDATGPSSGHVADRRPQPLERRPVGPAASPTASRPRVVERRPAAAGAGRRPGRRGSAGSSRRWPGRRPPTSRRRSSAAGRPAGAGRTASAPRRTGRPRSSAAPPPGTRSTGRPRSGRRRPRPAGVTRLRRPMFPPTARPPRRPPRRWRPGWPRRGRRRPRPRCRRSARDGWRR